MKGVVFTEFMEMVETSYGEATVEEILDKSGASGIYTAVGTYPHSEMVQLLMALSEHVKTPAGDLLKAFGLYLFNSFTNLYPVFFDGVKHSFDFLENVEGYVHVEVKKIYAEAELPRFEVERLSDRQLKMIYHSDRRMGALAVGLIEGCMKHFGDKGKVSIVSGDANDPMVEFMIDLEA